MRMHSSIDMVEPAMIARNATSRLVGDFVRMVASVAGGEFVGCLPPARRLATMSRSEPSEKCLAIGMERRLVGLARRRPEHLAQLACRDRRFRRSLRAGRADRPPRTVCVARPDHSASPYSIRLPVRPRYMPKLPPRLGSRIAAADIREEADADLRHGELRVLGHHAVRAVKGDADAAAHDDAVDQRDIGFPEPLDLRR